MLENTLATTFKPGMNLKHDVAGANWSFLLPRFALDTVVCYGFPGGRALKTLKRMAGELVIVAPEGDARATPDGARLLRGFEAALPLAAGSVDLVCLASRAARRHIGRHKGAQDEIARVLKPDGFLYAEPGGPADRELARGELDALVGRFGQSVGFWLTPRGGEAQTAVPEVDAGVRRYFLKHRLFSPSIHVAGIGAGKGNDAGVSGSATPAGRRSATKRLRQRLRPLAAALQAASDRVEAASYHHASLPARRGVLIGRTVDSSVPRYLTDIAASAGIDLGGWRWGLVARGEYSSRKVLFFLYPPEAEQPAYIVKMVRDAAFNGRVENECCALRWLAERGIAAAETTPQAAFFGYHGGLALVGETIIDGKPFRAAGRGGDALVCATQALNWLVDLGSATARADAAPEVVAAGLQTLVERFIDIYQPGQAERDFLNAQVDTIRRSRQSIPLVFQHGDPGVWNVVITPQGRAAFLDWEAAEVQGMPLWDLLYFWRSFAIDTARSEGIQDALGGFRRHFLNRTPLYDTLAQAIRRLCAATGLPAELVRPLFYLCWMHRALKQATLLPVNQVNNGHYRNLLALCIEKQDEPALAQLLLAG